MIVGAVVIAATMNTVMAKDMCFVFSNPHQHDGSYTDYDDRVWGVIKRRSGTCQTNGAPFCVLISHYPSWFNGVIPNEQDRLPPASPGSPWNISLDPEWSRYGTWHTDKTGYLIEITFKRRDLPISSPAGIFQLTALDGAILSTCPVHSPQSQQQQGCPVIQSTRANTGRFPVAYRYCDPITGQFIDSN